MASSVKRKAESPGCNIKIYDNDQRVKPKIQIWRKTVYLVSSHESTCSHGSFSMPPNDVVCYTLESDISIGSGSCAGSCPGV